MEIQAIIKNRRLELGLTMKEVAKALGVAEATVSRYESGEIQNMGIDKVEALSKILQCSPGYLMGWQDFPNQGAQYSLEHGELRLINIYRTLNQEGKDKLVERAEELRSLGYVKSEMQELA